MYLAMPHQTFQPSVYMNAQTIVLSDLDQVTIIDFQLRPNKTDVQFLGHSILDGKLEL